MAIIFEVRYPNGERAWAVGYPGAPVRVDIVPRGPESCYGDLVEIDFDAPSPHPVLRIVGGPRRPTLHVRVPGTDADRERWMDLHDREGWNTKDSDDHDDIVWCVAYEEGLDPEMLVRGGASFVRR